MNTYQIKLSPLSSFSRFPTSDTLFGAICWGIKRLYNESKLVEILESFQEKPTFVITSSFPYVECNGNPLSFYPKPITPGLSASDIEDMVQSKKDKKEKVEIITQYKKFKKAELVSLSIFNRIVKAISEKALFQEFYSKDIILEGKLLMTKKECEDFNTARPLFQKELVQKNAIDRLTMSTGEEGHTFYQEEYYASQTLKLHFLMKTDVIEFFKPVFRYLEDKGIGGNRSVGKGRFRIDVLNYAYIGDDISHTFITLSRYIPDVLEINTGSNFMFYEVFPYRSKVDSEAEFKGEDIWKSRVMYLKEGSCLEAKGKKEFYGRMPVVKEIKGQKIYQNGLAFPVFCNIGGSR